MIFMVPSLLQIDQILVSSASLFITFVPVIIFNRDDTFVNSIHCSDLPIRSDTVKDLITHRKDFITHLDRVHFNDPPGIYIRRKSTSQ